MFWHSLLFLGLTLTTGMMRPFRVMCLHGKGSNPERFSSQLQPLVRYLGPRARFEWLQAPYPLESDSSTFQWWILPEGQRSFEAEHYTGATESIAMVESEIRRREIDVVIGHSQGSMLLAALLAQRLQKGSPPLANQQQQQQQPRFGAILSSPAWPRPYTPEIAALSDSRPSSAQMQLHCVFTVGAKDAINPPIHTREIAEHFRHRCGETSCHILEHKGGHVLPVDEASLAFLELHVFSHF